MSLLRRQASPVVLGPEVVMTPEPPAPVARELWVAGHTGQRGAEGYDPARMGMIRMGEEMDWRPQADALRIRTTTVGTATVLYSIPVLSPCRASYLLLRGQLGKAAAIQTITLRCNGDIIGQWRDPGRGAFDLALDVNRQIAGPLVVQLDVNIWNHPQEDVQRHRKLDLVNNIVETVTRTPLDEMRADIIGVGIRYTEE